MTSSRRFERLLIQLLRPALSKLRYSFVFAARPLNVPQSRWKNAFFGCSSRNRAPHPKIFCVCPLKQPGAARAAFVDTSRAFVFEPTAAADEVSISSDGIVFLRPRFGRAGGRTRPAKASRRLRSCKKSMRPGVRIDWPECLRRSLKRSCHDRQLVCRKREEFPPDHRPDACVRLRLRWILSENQTCPGPALAMTNAGISSAWKGR